LAKVEIEVVEGIAWLASKPKRIKIAVGGRGSAKSTGVAGIMLNYANNGQRICAAREFQNSIDDSVHENLREEIDRLELKGFDVLANEIRTYRGGEIFYKGLARNITSLKSLVGVNKLWIEEGESISEKTLKVLTPSIRSTAASNEEGAEVPEIWVTMNRQSREDAIAKKYLARAEDELARCGRYEDEMVMVVQVNYTENPWFPPELEQERLDDKEQLSSAEYDHIWGGEYNEAIDNALIKKEWFDASIDAAEKLGITPTGAVVATHDVADTGDDACAYAARKGVHYFTVEEIAAENGNEACDIATAKAIDDNADLFVYDADGMGTLLRAPIAKNFAGIKCEIRGYKGSGAVEDKKSVYEGDISKSRKDKPKTNAEAFANKRAQFYTKLAQRFYNTYLAVEKGKYVDPDSIISISSDIPLLNKLRSEVCRLPLKPNGTGKIQLVSKPEMLSKYDIKSPNMADCLAMGEEIPAPLIKIEPITFTGWGG
jgi:phage terminase large subunit